MMTDGSRGASLDELPGPYASVLSGVLQGADCVCGREHEHTAQVKQWQSMRHHMVWSQPVPDCDSDCWCHRADHMCECECRVHLEQISRSYEYTAGRTGVM